MSDHTAANATPASMATEKHVTILTNVALTISATSIPHVPIPLVATHVHATLGTLATVSTATTLMNVILELTTAIQTPIVII